MSKIIGAGMPIPARRIAIGASGGSWGYIRVGGGLRPFWGESGGSFGPWKGAWAGVYAPFPPGSP